MRAAANLPSANGLRASSYTTLFGLLAVTYAEVRACAFPRPTTQAFFVSARGTRITEWSARYTFAKISQQIGLRTAAKGHGRGPRIHDMRHRFAAHTLIEWYQAGVDVERELPKLATRDLWETEAEGNGNETMVEAAGASGE